MARPAHGARVPGKQPVDGDFASPLQRHAVVEGAQYEGIGDVQSTDVVDRALVDREVVDVDDIVSRVADIDGVAAVCDVRNAIAGDVGAAIEQEAAGGERQ